MLSRLAASKGTARGPELSTPENTEAPHLHVPGPVLQAWAWCPLRAWEPFQDVHLWGKGAVQTECRPLS